MEGENTVLFTTLKKTFLPYKFEQSWELMRVAKGEGGRNFHMYAFGVGLRYANLSNIMLAISNSLFNILL